MTHHGIIIARPVFHCRICQADFYGLQNLARHVARCAQINEDFVDHRRPPEWEFGDPEMRQFALDEGDVYNRRPGTRRRAR